MSDVAIRVENLSKRYRIGRREKYLTLSEVLTRSFTAPFRLFRRNEHSSDTNHQSQDNYIWALKDVSFEVKRGEVVGIIGRNGAGKSTLLKILARITDPTEGYAEVRGRVGSLLEVGTGFHPELTGRENIYLSGAVLGMKKKEIDKKFDEIVEFAEIEKFIDTPIKHYSSGMYIRLAFAVAAHLEPEILLVDEILAVGDTAFQRKCLGKMENVAKEGRTVLFVSHNMAAIENLCSKAILLNNGCITNIGDTRSVIQTYLKTSLPPESSFFNLENLTERKGTGQIRFTYFYIEDSQGNRLPAIKTGQDVVFVFGFKCVDNVQLRNIDFRFSIYTLTGERLTDIWGSYLNQVFKTVPIEGEARCIVSRFPLASGQYNIHAKIIANNTLSDSISSIYINVIEGDFWGTGRIPRQPILFLISGKWFLKDIKT